jgi:hypothetical protein
LHHGFAFLGQFVGLRSVDAPALRCYFDQLLGLELELLPNSPNADSVEFENQYDFDDWIMVVASLYYAALPLSEALQTVAQPIMSLGAGAHYWIQDFLQAFFRYAPGLCTNDIVNPSTAELDFVFVFEQHGDCPALHPANPVVIRTMSALGALVTATGILPALQVPSLYVANADISQP